MSEKNKERENNKTITLASGETVEIDFVSLEGIKIKHEACEDQQAQAAKDLAKHIKQARSPIKHPK